MEQSKRSAICELRRAGQSPAYIAKSLQYPRQTVYDVCKHFDISGHDQRSPYKPRSDNIQTSRFLGGLKRRIKANSTSTLSFLTLVKKRAVSKTAIHRGVLYLDKLVQLPKGSPKYLSLLIQNELRSVLDVKQLGLKSYVQGKRHLLTTKMKEVYLMWCKKLLNW